MKQQIPANEAFVVIAEWQDYLWRVFNRRQTPEGLAEIKDQFVPVNSRHWRYGNAQNVSMYSVRLVAFLRKENIKFHITDGRGEIAEVAA